MIPLNALNVQSVQYEKVIINVNEVKVTNYY